MKTHLNKSLIALALASAFAALASAQSGSFSDGFEGPSLDSFWTVSTNYGGAVIYPSTAQKHGGSQSVKLFVPESSGQDSFAILSHVFDGGVYGRLSLWFYDSGESTAAHFDFSISGPGFAVAGVYSPEDTNGHYVFLTSGGTPLSPLQRTQGWHHLTINSVPGSLDLAIDGATYHSADGFVFTGVQMRWYSDGGVPGGTIHVDDFTFTPVPGVAADCLRLNFDSLPSAQGWQLIAAPALDNEMSIFSVDGAKLAVNSTQHALYQILNATPTNQSCTLTVRARVLESSGTAGFLVKIDSLVGGYAGYTLTTNRLEFDTGSSNQTRSIDTTTFHTYRLEMLAGSWARLFVDGVLLVEGFPIDGDDNDLVFGAVNGSSPPQGRTRVEIAQFELCKRQGPTLSVSVASMDVCWDSLSNRLYQVQYRSSLTTNQWANLGIPVTGNGATNCITDIVRGEPQRFYRAVETP